MSNKYTFTQEYTDDYGQTSKVEHVFYTDYHTEIAERFNEFLRGCGYYFNEGESYQLVGEPDTEELWTTTDLGDAVLDEFDYAPQDNNYAYPANSWPFDAVPQNVVCPKCGMRRTEMGGSKCYEASGCGLGLDGAL